MSDTSRILVVLAHPALEKSQVNGPMARAASTLPNVTVHDLYEHYPQFFIDKVHEQKLIVQHDVIVLQHPLYWYSAPALLKEWLDIVFEHGFAYGRRGKGVVGRYLLNAWSAGSPRSAFFDGANPPLVPQLMRPFQCTAEYCGMNYLPPLCHFNTGEMTARDVDAAAERYAALLKRLQWPAFRDRDFANETTMNDSLERLENNANG